MFYNKNNLSSIDCKNVSKMNNTSSSPNSEIAYTPNVSVKEFVKIQNNKNISDNTKSIKKFSRENSINNNTYTPNSSKNDNNISNSEIDYTSNVNVRNTVKKINTNGNDTLIKNKSFSTTNSTRGDKRNDNISELDENIEKHIEEVAKDGIETFRKDMGKVNIIIAGRSGVGKSTLINSIFHGNFAKTAIGKPVTQEINEISKEGIPVTIIDTKGLEIKDYKIIKNELETYILERNNNKDPHMHIHVAWVCLAEGSDRYEDAELDLLKMLNKNKIPVIIVITKSESEDGEKFKKIIQEEIEKLHLTKEKIFVIRVMAKEKVLDDGHIVRAKNLDILIRETNKLIPIGIQNALAGAQKVILDLKKESAKRILEKYKNESLKAKNERDLINYTSYLVIGISGVFGLNLNEKSITKIVKKLLSSHEEKSMLQYIKNIFNFIYKIITNDKTYGKNSSKFIEIIGNLYINALYESFKEIDLLSEIDIPSEELIEKCLTIAKQNCKELNPN